MVIGGIAAIAHGSSRLTQDLDICFATPADNLLALGDVLTGLGSRLRGVDEDLPFTPDAGTLRNVQLLTLTTDKGWLDVMSAPAGAPPFETLFENSVATEIGGVTVRVASIDDLIAMKRAAGRSKDLGDIAELEAIKRLTEESG